MRNVTLAAVLVLFAWSRSFTSETKPAKVVGPDATTGMAQAVVLDDVTLIQTTQLLPAESREGSSREQAQHLVSNLGKVLANAGSGLQHLVRANLYATQQEHLDELKLELAGRSTGQTFPVVTAVVTALPLTEAAVAIDALAIVPGAKARRRRLQAIAGPARATGFSSSSSCASGRTKSLCFWPVREGEL